MLNLGFPTKKYPLQGIFALDQAKAIGSLGHRVILISIDIRSIRRIRKWGLQKLNIEKNVTIYNINFPLGRLPPLIITKAATLLLELMYKIVNRKEGKPDIIHVHFCYPLGFAAAKLKLKYNLPLVITEHSTSLEYDCLKSQSKYFQFAYNHADKIIAVGNNLKKAINHKFGIESDVIFNLVDLDIFNYKEKKSSNQINFLSVANLNYRKGMDVLINAFSRMCCKDTKLFIIGDGPERKKLQNQINELGMESNIFLLGRKKRDEITEFLYNSEVFVLASRFETFGVVYIEALATGTPVIATNCGGPPDFVTPENGLLVEVDNIPMLTEALISMKENRNRYDRKKISETTRRIFSPYNIAKQIERVYYELIN
jgi:glycosyltransferase involved in cell wall biosynthesis